jgi:peptidylamidoglycolate lyase
MNRYISVKLMAVAGFVFIALFGARVLLLQGQAPATAQFVQRAIPAEKGGQDVYGPYEVVADWPKPLTSLPGHEKWTRGTVSGVFAESPDRVFILQQGEVPAMKRPPTKQYGPSLEFPIPDLPFRRIGGEHVRDEIGLDRRWEHCLVVVNSKGDVVEAWTQWDAMFKHPHAVFINPYDPDKNVWVVDDGKQAIFKFTNDGKKLLQTIGTPDVAGSDGTHFGRPTYLAWLPDSTMFLSDGYDNTRVVKFDKSGEYLTTWGQKGNPPNETRAGYFNSVHGIAVDPTTRQVYVNDRANRRTQVFDENGKFLDQWSFGRVSSVFSTYMSADRHLWAADAVTTKMLKYDLGGHFLYSWGSLGDWPGAIWGVHQISVDQEGNLYVAEVSNGRAEKFRPRAGANPDFIVGQPIRAAWH